MLARFGSALTLEPDTPIDEKQYELRELFSARGSLVKDRIRLINRLQTQTLALVKRQTKARIEQLTRQLKAIQQDINTRLQECPQRARANTILRSIPGIGEVAALSILIELPEVGTLRQKKAASLTGLAPPLVHINMHCRAMDDPTIRKVAWKSAHSRWTKTVARRALLASSRRGQTQPRYARQIPRHDHKRQTTKGRTDNNHAQTHRARKHIDQRRPRMDAKHRLTKTDTHRLSPCDKKSFSYRQLTNLPSHTCKHVLPGNGT